ncbi:MAG: ADOP family duplicated permease [Gemmatimonadales bacterium]
MTSTPSSNAERAPWWEAFVQDLRYAARGLRAKPGFTIAVVLTLGLGIGANAAMFSIVDRLLFRAPAMLRDAATTHRVYTVNTYRGKEGASSSIAYGRFKDFERTTTAFSRFAQFTARDMAIGGGDDAREMRVGAVSASFFDFFDAPPAVGRYFTAAEDSAPNGTPVAVLSYGYWQTAFGGRHDAIGATLRVGSLVYTVIGVLPAGFAGLWPDQPPVAYIPIASFAATQGFAMAGQNWWTTYNWTWSNTLAQRKPGVSVAAATADISKAYLRSYENEIAGSKRATPVSVSKPHAVIASVLSERGPNESSLAKVATWISGVALIVLLIACANVANLLLARALNRRREIAVRLALGVSRRRLLSQLLTESVLLAALGGFAGLVIAQAGGALLRAAFLPKAVAHSIVTDPRTLLFAALAALAAGVLTGLAPAFQLRSVNLTSDLKTGAREGTFHRSRLRVALLLMQGALSVVLLVGAGLFVRSLDNVRGIRMGYDIDPILLVNLNMRGVTLDSAATVLLRAKLLAAAKAIPGVENASLQTSVPFWSSWSEDLHVAGIDSVRKLGQFNLNGVSPEYFATLGTRIVQGRGITEADAATAPGAMVVSAGMAKRLWPSSNAIGQCVKMGSDTTPCIYVVGVAEDIKAQRLDADDAYYYYLSSAQFNPQQGGLFVRTHAKRGVLASETVRRALQKEMPGASYVTITPFADIVGGQTKSWELGASMFLTFGLLALLLAAIGLFSVISYNVAQRTHELGVRVALGAQMSDLIRLVVTEGVKLGALGVGIGAAIALASARWMAPLLFKESPRDPVIFGVVAAVLLSVTVVASLIPARRAARVDPNRALRSD